VVFISSLLIHIVFSLQALSVAEQGGMIRNTLFMLLFYPHVLLMYFLPPAKPIGYSGAVVAVDWFRFVGKLAVAYPASLLYGLACGAVRHFLIGKKTV
jgi:hypothetical protein